MRDIGRLVWWLLGAVVISVVMYYFFAQDPGSDHRM